MSRTLVLVLGVGLWMVSPGRAADKPDTLNMPRPVAGAEPAGQTAFGEEYDGHEVRGGRWRCCLSNFRDWLCYRDPERPCKPELCGSVPCCRPQLHSFFIHR